MELDFGHGFIPRIGKDNDKALDRCIGSDRKGSLLELLYRRATEQVLVIHAMPRRPVFLTYLAGSDHE